MTVLTALVPRIYVACLASYNAGRLHGEWIEASDPDTMMSGILGMLVASPVPDAEEWAIHDYEGFGDVSLSEFQSLESVAAMGEFIQEHERLASALLSHFGGDLEEARQALEDNYAGQYNSLKDFAESFTEETGGLEQVPQHMRAYIDFEAMADDMEMSGDVFALEPRLGEIHVFWSR